MKMMDEEEVKKYAEGKEGLEKKDCPLSPEGWIMLLSSEINNCMVLFMMVGVLTASSLLVIIGIMVKVLGSTLSYLFITFGLYLCLCFFIGYHWFQKRVKPLINTREAIISDELTDFSEIHRKWNEYIKKYYGKLLEKSEMDEEEKELNEGEEKSEEKNLEQKEDPQVPQGDIRDIKESLHGIESTLGKLISEIEEINFSNSFCVFGSLLVAGGLMILTLPKYPPLQCLQWIAGFTAFVIGLIFIVVGCIRNVAKMQLKRKIINRKT